MKQVLVVKHVFFMFDMNSNEIYPINRKWWSLMPHLGNP